MRKIFIALGCFFITISTFLYATKHITAAIMSSNINNTKANYYEGSYELVGFGMSFWIGISLIIGIIFLIGGLWSVIKGTVHNKQKK